MKNPLKILANVYKKSPITACLEDRRRKSNLKIHKDPDEWTRVEGLLLK